MIHRWLIFVCLLFAVSALEAQNSPVTTATSLFGCVNGQVTVPLQVTGFTSVGALSLDIQYDPAVLTYIQIVKNPLLTGSFFAGDFLLPSGKRHVVMSWFGNAVNLADGSSIADLKFTYNSGTTELTWLDDGSSCEYADGSFNPLNDLPTSCYYVNGKVTSDKFTRVGLFLEGLYNTVWHQMISVSGNLPVPCTTAIADEVTIELHNSLNYPVVEYSVSGLSLDVSGWVQLTVPAAKSGNYYIVVRHRNSVVTASALPVSFAGNSVEYNFRDAAAKAFGSNMKLMPDGVWAIFTGDLNQDNAVDATDISQAGTHASGFSTGYLTSDCNGDGIVEAADLILIDNNAKSFVHAVLP